MDKMVFFEIEEWEKPHIEKAFPHVQLIFSSHKVQDETNKDIFNTPILSTFIYSALDKDMLSKFENLKLLATRSTGFDHIDITYCKENGITVVNVPSYGAHTVAEHTFALMLATSRKLIPTIDRSKRGDFSLKDLRGFDLNGKKLGVIGAGKIGQKVIVIAQAFGMHVLIYTNHPQQNTEAVRYVSLDELLGSSDIVSLHLPHTKQTHHVINRVNIKKFKKGSILINTARGPLIETQAILEGLESGILKAAGLDVLEEECSLKEERELLTEEFLKTCDIKTQLLNHVLLTRDDVLFTSHNAFNSIEALAQILETTITNIQSFLQGNLQNRVG